MKNDYRKRLFKYTKFFIILFFIVYSIFVTKDAFATPGACSAHGGVNCSMGMQPNGKVYCNDGWTDSIVSYDFTAMCQNNKPSCNIVEWNDLKKKYDIDGLYYRTDTLLKEMDNNIYGAFDIGLANSLQLQYNALKGQSDFAYNQAKTQCYALGSIKADEKLVQDFKLQLDYNAKLEASKEAIARLEQERQKVLTDSLVQLDQLNKSACLSNSKYLNGQCVCNRGYVFSGSACITYTQSCRNFNNNDLNIVGTKGNDGKTNCNCNAGYVWNGNQCAVNQPQTTTPPPAQKTYESVQTGEYLICNGKTTQFLKADLCNQGYAPKCDLNNRITCEPTTTKETQVEWNPILEVPKKVVDAPRPSNFYDDFKAEKKELPKEIKKAVTSEATTTQKQATTAEIINQVQPKQNIVFKTFGSVKNFFLRIFR